ncbi:MAG: hypothetical protein AB200_00480 [Parcubacteria bacterium C7867-005]|nr:MAG: hypothetical protein AB200_00480 [Parcubacteria bacterium C7867-005]
MKKIIIALIVIVLGVLIIRYFTSDSVKQSGDQTATTTTTTTGDQTSTTPGVVKKAGETVIGKSVQGNDITAYHFGKGTKEILFIGGIHGGYSWNTSLVAYEAMDYFKATPDIIPANVRVTVIPVLNPDGLKKVMGKTGRVASADAPATLNDTVPGRFNANDVDLNRNFDCDWQTTGTWQSKTVSGGAKAFSEPESRAIKTYVEANKLTAVVTWYSSAGGVYASSCHNGVSKETDAITKEYASGSGYPAYQSFDFYEITGDMVNWFAKMKIPAISVLLTNHTDTEWIKNKNGINSLLEYYAD